MDHRRTPTHDGGARLGDLRRARGADPHPVIGGWRRLRQRAVVALRRPDPAVLPVGFRAPALVAVPVAVAVLVALAVRYAGEHTGAPLDQRIDPWIGNLASGYWITWRIVALASPPPVVVMAFVLAALAVARHRHRLALLAVVGPGLTGLLTLTLKPLIGRTLNGLDTFPSGHTGGATAIALVASLLVVDLLPAAHRIRFVLVPGVTVLVACCVGAAMVAESLHYATDVVGGFCVAVSSVLGLALVLERLPVRRLLRARDQGESADNTRRARPEHTTR